MSFMDAHCHFDFPVFDGRREPLLSAARQVGVSRLVVPGVREADWPRVVAVADQFPEVAYCLGIHPWFVDEHGPGALDRLRQAVTGGSGCLGIGECGLDRLRGSLDQQLPWFEGQLDMARDLKLPVVVHSVRTHDEVAAVLRRKPLTAPMLVHGFAGSYQQARVFVDQGCMLGIGGVITYPRASKTRNAVAALPLDALVLETDAPDMPPSGVAKGANEPARLADVFRALLELRPEPADVLEEALWNNATRLYGRAQ